MAALLHAGASSTDLGTAGTKRDDISDYLAACLVLANNVAGSLRIGPEFADSIAQWDEDRLNNDFITDIQAGGMLATTSITVSAADAAILDIGALLIDTSTTLGGIGNGEMLFVSAISGVTVTVTRAYAGSTQNNGHAQNAIYSIIGRPTYENSTLGRDMSRARIRKFNYIHRHEINVNLSSEVIARSKAGYTPGINDELEYQFFNRTQEILRLWNKSCEYSRPSPGTTGTTGFSGGDYSSMAGMRSWLDQTQNATSVIYDFAANGLTTGQVDVAINSVNKLLYRNGTVPDWCVGGPNVGERVGVLYNDRMRLQQDETTRGFAAQYFRTTLGNELRLLVDGFIPDATPVADIFILDSARWRLRPFWEQLFFVITAPTLNDGDTVRALSKLSLEARNTGTDSGQASMLIRNASMV